MGGNAVYWFVDNRADLFAGFYTFSAMPGTKSALAKLNDNKPLYSLNAKDDEVFPYANVEAAWALLKKDAPGWHFKTMDRGGHRFIYNVGGAQ